MLRVIKVTGRSLEPVYQDGDFVFISKIPILFGRIFPGDVIVFNHTDYGTMIKIVDYLDPSKQEIRVIGLAGSSIDSRRFGPVPTSSITGKVVWHIRRPN